MEKSGIVILMIVFTALCALLFVLFYENAEKTAVRRPGGQVIQEALLRARCALFTVAWQ